MDAEMILRYVRHQEKHEKKVEPPQLKFIANSIEEISVA